MMAGDEGSSATGGSSGENEGTSGQAVPHKAPRASPKQPPTSARKAGGKPGGCTSRGGKEGGRGWGTEEWAGTLSPRPALRSWDPLSTAAGIGCVPAVCASNGRVTLLLCTCDKQGPRDPMGAGDEPPLSSGLSGQPFLSHPC